MKDTTNGNHPSRPTSLPLRLLPLLGLILVSGAAHAGGPHQFHRGEVGTADVGVEFKRVVTRGRQVRFVMTVHNRTEDHLLLDPYGFEIKLDSGTFTYVDSTVAEGYWRAGPGSRYDIHPGDSNTFEYELNAQGPVPRSDFLEIRVHGVSRYPTSGTPVSAPDLPLVGRFEPFKAGPFSCAHDETEFTQRTTETTIRCAYDGLGMGLIDPTELQVVQADGAVLENKYVNLRIMESGRAARVRVEVRQSGPRRSREGKILWREALQEAEIAKVPLAPVKLEAWNLKR